MHTGKSRNHGKAVTLECNLGFIISWKKKISLNNKEGREELICPAIVDFNGICKVFLNKTLWFYNWVEWLIQLRKASNPAHSNKENVVLIFS